MQKQIICSDLLSLMQVHTNGHLSIEFSFDDFMRIRNWKFQIKENAELIPKSALLECKGDQTKLDAISNNITESGLSSATLEYLRVRKLFLIEAWYMK